MNAVEAQPPSDLSSSSSSSPIHEKRREDPNSVRSPSFIFARTRNPFPRIKQIESFEREYRKGRFFARCFGRLCKVLAISGRRRSDSICRLRSSEIKEIPNRFGRNEKSFKDETMFW